MKRPLFPCLIGLALGEAAAISFGFKGGLFLALLFLLTGCLTLFWRKKRSFFCLWIFSAASLLGFLLFLHAWENREPLADIMLPVEGSIRGRITFLQVDKEGEYDITLENVQYIPGSFGRTDEGKNGSASENVRYAAESSTPAKGEGNTEDVRGDCRVFHLKEGMGQLQPGDWIVCQGELTALSQPANPGEFNSQVYYQSKGISCQFFADSFVCVKRGGLSLTRIAFWVRRAVAGVYNRILGEDYAALLHAMVLGDKGALSEEQKLRYEENGVAHLLSVSGLHVSIMAGSWFRFLRKRKLPYGPACAGGLLLLIFYGCLTGFGNSILRAVIMYGVFLGAEYFGAGYDMTSSMSLAGVLMLLESPWRLLEGGCQMSFAAVFAIGYVLPWVKELAKKRKGEEDGRIRRFARWRRGMGDALLSSVVISAVTLPVVLRVFYTFSPYSVLINLIVIPCMTPMMVSGIVAGVTGVFLLPAAEWAGTLLTRGLFLPAVGVLGFFDFFLEHMRQLPGAVWTAGCPTFLEMGILYLLEGLLLYIWYRRRWRLGVQALLLMGLWFVLAPSGPLRVTMLDVGQGDSILLQLPGGENVLIDGGSTSRQAVGQYVIAPALHYYGIAKIDYVVATHMDADHISGIEELFAMGYPIRRVLLPAAAESPGGRGDAGEAFASQGEKSAQDGEEQGVAEELEAFASQAEKAGAEVIYMERGDSIRFAGQSSGALFAKDGGSGPILRCLHPYAGFESGDKNAASLVFYLQYDGFDALFTGDLEKEGEEALCSYLESELLGQDGQNPGVELLKVAHHGSRYSTRERFLKLIRPHTALISAGEHNRYGHPHEETLGRLRDCGTDVYETAENGAIFVETDGKRWAVRTFLENGS